MVSGGGQPPLQAGDGDRKFDGYRGGGPGPVLHGKSASGRRGAPGWVGVNGYDGYCGECCPHSGGNGPGRGPGRTEPGEVKLLAATKMNDAARVRAAVAAGVDICGENRVQELQEKLPQGAYTGAPVHFIGHLQKNKAKYLVGQVDLIQSVDSLELLALIRPAGRAAGHPAGDFAGSQYRRRGSKKRHIGRRRG